MSRSTMRPPGPEPVTLRGSMPSSAATRLARGLMVMRPPAGWPTAPAGHGLRLARDLHRLTRKRCP